MPEGEQVLGLIARCAGLTGVCPCARAG
jgi:hypothetical protein